MTRMIEVEIDDSGMVRPMDPAAALPHGRALLVWQTEPDRDSMILSEASLATDWLKPEEDGAWAAYAAGQNFAASHPQVSNRTERPANPAVPGKTNYPGDGQGRFRG